MSLISETNISLLKADKGKIQNPKLITGCCGTPQNPLYKTTINGENYYGCSTENSEICKNAVPETLTNYKIIDPSGGSYLTGGLGKWELNNGQSISCNYIVVK